MSDAAVAISSGEAFRCLHGDLAGEAFRCLRRDLAGEPFRRLHRDFAREPFRCLHGDLAARGVPTSRRRPRTRRSDISAAISRPRRSEASDAISRRRPTVRTRSRGRGGRVAQAHARCRGLLRSRVHQLFAEAAGAETFGHPRGHLVEHSAVTSGAINCTAGAGPEAVAVLALLDRKQLRKVMPRLRGDAGARPSPAPARRSVGDGRHQVLVRVPRVPEVRGGASGVGARQPSGVL